MATQIDWLGSEHIDSFRSFCCSVICMSNELHSILARFDAMGAAKSLSVLATVIDVRGSSYRLPGARMLIDGAGNTYGTVSGGCLEADLMTRAAWVRESGESEVFVYDTSINDDSVFGLNMGCRGVIRVLLEPADPKLFELLRHRLSSREGGVVATLVSTAKGGSESRVGSRLLIDERGLVASDIVAAAQAIIADDCFGALRTKTSTLNVYEFGEVFIEYIAPPVPLVVFGAGHDAAPLIRFAKELGWHVTVVDHRAASSKLAQFSVADNVIVARPQEAAGLVPIDKDTAAVLMTHNYAIDLELAEFLLRSPARYVGMLGPRSRAERMLADLSRIGVDAGARAMKRAYAPIGIDIGAETPEEIALSIIAEICAVLAGRGAGMLRHRAGSIHGRADESDAAGIESGAGRVDKGDAVGIESELPDSSLRN